jgi:glycerol transport system ATP-binding protein
MARILLDNVAHAYGPTPRGLPDYALKPLNHAWENGGAYALLGPSGCGKTTLLNIISGLITPKQGRILFDGKDVTQLPTAQRNIAQVFQFPVIYDTMTVAQNLAFPLRNRQFPAAEVSKRVSEVAQMLELTAILGKKARGLTADVKQKVSLGRGLVRPDVSAILFDEPLTVIDPHLKWQLRSQLKALHRQFDLTMIYVTHDQTEALTFADTVVVMYEGEVVQIGTPADLFERPAHTFVGYFIGSPGMNVLPADLRGNHAVIGGGYEIELDRAYREIPPGTRLEIGVRPEYVRLSSGEEGIPVAVQRVDDIGRIKVARVRLDGVHLNVVAPEDARIEGDASRILFQPGHVHLYADGHLVGGAAS